MALGVGPAGGGLLARLAELVAEGDAVTDLLGELELVGVPAADAVWVDAVADPVAVAAGDAVAVWVSVREPEGD